MFSVISYYYFLRFGECFNDIHLIRKCVSFFSFSQVIIFVLRLFENAKEIKRFVGAYFFLIYMHAYYMQMADSKHNSNSLRAQLFIFDEYGGVDILVTNDCGCMPWRKLKWSSAYLLSERYDAVLMYNCVV